MNATGNVKVCCQVCKKAVALHLVKDFAHKTFHACGGCIGKMNKAHPVMVTVIR